MKIFISFLISVFTLSYASANTRQWGWNADDTNRVYCSSGESKTKTEELHDFKYFSANWSLDHRISQWIYSNGEGCLFAGNSSGDRQTTGSANHCFLYQTPEHIEYQIFRYIDNQRMTAEIFTGSRNSILITKIDIDKALPIDENLEELQYLICDIVSKVKDN